MDVLISSNNSSGRQEKKRQRRERKKKEQEQAEAGNVKLISWGVRKNFEFEENEDENSETTIEYPLHLISQDAKKHMEETFHYSEDAIKMFNSLCGSLSPNDALAQISSQYPRSVNSLRPELSAFLLNPGSHVGTQVTEVTIGPITNIVYMTWLGNLSYMLKSQLKKCWKNWKCTYQVTQDNFVKQVGFHCSCFEDETMSICRVCAVSCHHDKSKHKLTQIANNKVMFCDCGAGVKTKYVIKCNCQ